MNLSEKSTNSDNTDKSQLSETEPKTKSFFEKLTNLVMKQYKSSKKFKYVYCCEVLCFEYNINNSRCSINGCELKFSKDDARINHESCHDNEKKKQFKCPHCVEKFSVWRMCSAHLWKCHNIDLGLLSCPKCKFKSASFSK